MSNGNKEASEKILQLVLSAMQQDKELREKYQIGDKFRFIRDRLSALESRIQENINSLHKEAVKKSDTIAEDEVLVYVYLYNAQGLAFQTWQKMVSPSVFYEYSVNRPVYTDKSHVEAFIRSRPNKNQHGYLTVVLKKQDILVVADPQLVKDSIGNPLVKIREGSLIFNQLRAFTHNNHEFIVSLEGQLVKKPSE